MKQIRNFSIIAHIDHGKSTLADRMIELTQTVEQRKMSNQVLDSMELEQERGITIKLAPVRMMHNNIEYNLIDTPGHIDFSYEVSRALRAVEGSILLVDATQGLQAQTFTTLSMARELGLVIIPVITKIDSPLASPDDVTLEIAELLDCDPDSVLAVSGKTGEGVPELLNEIEKRIPAPSQNLDTEFQGLVFDFEYSKHQGIIVYTRITQGSITKGQSIQLVGAGKKFNALDVGVFTPEAVSTGKLEAGEIGYLVTGIKEAGVASVGDTLAPQNSSTIALDGYQTPKPVVWASVYTESQDDFAELRTALERLRLSDSSLSFEEETSGTLGRGFRCGFLGMLHLEIVTERLRREHNVELIITSPSVTYRVIKTNSEELMVYSPPLFPDTHLISEIWEPWVKLTIISPADYTGDISVLIYEHEGEAIDTVNFGDGRIQQVVLMPLRELMRNFFDALKSVTSGHASLAYEFAEERSADVVRLDVLVASEPVPAFARVVSKRRVQEEAEDAVERLYKVLPRQQFVIKIQGQAMGKILASRTLKAFRKDVTAKLYGGDITRKMKLREKQKKGKKKMKNQGSVNIPQDVFLKMMKKGE